MDEINDNPIAIDAEDFAEVNLPETPADGGAIDWEAEAKKFQGIAARRGTKLAKFKDAKPPKDSKEQKPPAQDPKKGELDYGQKAYLNSLGFKDAEDQTYVQGIMKDTGRSLEDILSTPFVKSELQRMGEERATKAATPPADGSRNGSPARDSVEYWIAKGELPPSDQPELRQRVVNAKIAQQRTKSTFTSTPVVGNA